MLLMAIIFVCADEGFAVYGLMSEGLCICRWWLSNHWLHPVWEQADFGTTSHCNVWCAASWNEYPLNWLYRPIWWSDQRPSDHYEMKWTDQIKMSLNTSVVVTPQRRVYSCQGKGFWVQLNYKSDKKNMVMPAVMPLKFKRAWRESNSHP